MARGTTLGDTLKLLKGELGYSLKAGVAEAADDELYTLIDVKQQWLASEWSWPFMKKTAEVTASPGVGDGQRYLTVPTSINFDRPVKVETFWTNHWYPIEFGITTQEYNTHSSGDAGETAVQQDPVSRWDWKPGDSTKFEVWPLPSTTQTIRFEGQRFLTTLKSGGNYSDGTTLDLDDILVVLFAAAEKLARMKKADATSKLLMAQKRLATVRAGFSTRSDSEPVVLGRRYHNRPERRVVPLVLTA